MTTSPIERGSERAADGITPLGPILLVVFFASLGTGIFWNALAFIAKHAYDFGPARNLILAAVMGAVYMTGATLAGPITRLVKHRLAPRSLLALMLAGQVVVCIAPIVFAGEWALWTAAVLVTIASSLTWPIVEAYLTAGRHGPAMRSAIGWFNLVWMPAVAVPLLLMPPIIEHHAEWAIAAQSIANALALIPLSRFARGPGRHEDAEAEAHVPAEYTQLLRCARVLLPLSYLLFAAMNPILPYRFEAIGADVRVETPVTASWLLVRVVAVAVMWRVTFWHGRWGTLLLAGTAMAGGFGLVVLAPALDVMLLGFAIFGVGMGVSYYAALYYAMAVGRAAVDAGGRHEALIGAGYAVGPIAGLAGIALAGTSDVVTGEQGIVGMVWALVAVAGIAALRPYRRARRERGS